MDERKSRALASELRRKSCATCWRANDHYQYFNNAPAREIEQLASGKLTEVEK